ncbi:hypothetical protein [Helicobacter pylori]
MINKNANRTGVKAYASVITTSDVAVQSGSLIKLPDWTATSLVVITLA